MTEAPRFQAYLERSQGRSVLVMNRDDWNSLGISDTEMTRLDLSVTPLANLRHDTHVLASVVTQSSGPDAAIEIYRHDPKDIGMPVNKDRYLVWERIPSDVDVQNIINAASTYNDANLRQFIEENVFIVKQAPGPDHWLPDVPADVRVIMQTT